MTQDKAKKAADSTTLRSVQAAMSEDELSQQLSNLQDGHFWRHGSAWSVL